MCGALPNSAPLGYRRIERTVVRYERLNRFAADRMLGARSAGAHRFWKRVLDATVTVEEAWERDEAYWRPFRL